MHSLVVFLALWSSPSFALDQAMYEKYANSVYTYCDAEAVAAAFKISEADAKVYIGQKIDFGATDILDATIRKQRASNPGQFCDQTGVVSTAGSDDPADPWAEGIYDTCHAKMLATFWGLTSPSEAKATAVKMIASGQAVPMDTARGHARSQTKKVCTFQDTRYSYADAELLSKAWGKTVAETKVAMVDKYLHGNEQNLPAFLDAERRLSHVVMPEVIDGCHVKMLERFWGVPATEVKAVAKKRMASKDPAVRRAFANDLSLGREKLTSGSVTCQFADTRFRYEDAARVAKAWGTSVEEAKIMIVNKYKWGSENNVPTIR